MKALQALGATMWLTHFFILNSCKEISIVNSVSDIIDFKWHYMKDFPFKGVFILFCSEI